MKTCAEQEAELIKRVSHFPQSKYKDSVIILLYGVIRPALSTSNRQTRLSTLATAVGCIVSLRRSLLVQLYRFGQLQTWGLGSS